MLRITYEIVPYGDEAAKRTIGTQEIALQGVRGDMGLYHSRLEDDDPGPWPPPRREEVQVWHPRSNGAFNLIRAAIEEHYNPERTK